MRKLLVVLLLLVVGVVGLGLYQGWFKFSTGSDNNSGKANAGVTIDTDKIKSDAEKAKEKLGGTKPPRQEPRPGVRRHVGLQLVQVAQQAPGQGRERQLGVERQHRRGRPLGEKGGRVFAEAPAERRDPVRPDAEPRRRRVAAVRHQ